MKDPLINVHVLNSTPNPQTTCYYAMHQDYSSAQITKTSLTEQECGEVLIKRLLGKSGERGHYGCYSSDTEVLTDLGWVAWPKVAWSGTFKLAAVDIKTGHIHFEYPSAIHVVPFRDDDRMYSVASQKIDSLVTLDHRMVVSTRTSGNGFTDYRFASAASILGKAVKCMTGGELLEDERELPSDMPIDIDCLTLFQLAGFYFGDGVRSSNRNPRCLRFKLRRIRKIHYLKSLGIKVSVKKDDRYTLYHESAARWIHEHFSSENGKTIPIWILRLPSEALNHFLIGLKNSDGTAIGSSWALDSTEKASLDLLQAACHLNRIPASLSLNNSNIGEGHENHRPCWRLHFGSRGCFARQESNQKGRTRGVECLKEYSGNVYCATVSTGALLVRRNNKPLVSGNCLEHAQITFSVGYFPHSVMQQARTHRIGVSFDVQSMRYTSETIVQAAHGDIDIEKVIYLRPCGDYTDRKGKKYTYTEEDRSEDLLDAVYAVTAYADKISAKGFSEEHARGMLPFDYRQHFVVSFTLRALMHFLDLRSKKDAQQEIVWLSELLMEHFMAWAPEVAGWYKENRYQRARLAP